MDFSNPNVQIAVGVAIAVVLILIIVAVAVNSRKQRSEHLRKQFGPEYENVLLQQKDVQHAEAVLAEREKRVQKFTIRSLSSADRDRFVSDWANVQRRFVDDPAFAVNEADALVTQVMATRGYPMSDFEQRTADISVNYPRVVQNYRAARIIATRHSQGQASTEDLRQAMVHYRSLFEELLDTRTTVAHADVAPADVRRVDERVAS
jgi:hypothetical protein